MFILDLGSNIAFPEIDVKSMENTSCFPPPFLNQSVLSDPVSAVFQYNIHVICNLILTCKEKCMKPTCRFFFLPALLQQRICTENLKAGGWPFPYMFLCWFGFFSIAMSLLHIPGLSFLSGCRKVS